MAYAVGKTANIDPFNEVVTVANAVGKTANINPVQRSCYGG
ncbi:hypothetical protein [Staphylococcus equorum]|nr:hypothetical protein [Staphylococcus equorum]